MRPIAYTVHGPAEAPVLVAERFSPVAALLAPLWLLGNFAWVPFLVYSAVIGAAVAVQLLLLPACPVILMVAIAASLFIGFEAGEIRRAVIVRRGGTLLGVVTGHDRAEAEDRVILRSRS